MKIGFIGAGKVGFTLGKYFSTKGVSLTGYYSQNPQSAKEAALFTGSRIYDSLSGIAADSDTLFLTVPDGAIESVWDSIRLLPIENKNICHCSGSLSSQIFSDIEKAGAFGYSIHPLCAVSDRFITHTDFSNVHFTIEGSQFNMEAFFDMFEKLGNPLAAISAEHKTVYHAASVMVSNHIVALAQIGSELFAQCGLPETFSKEAWASLFLGNAENVCRSGPVQALTGPVERGDWQTVSGHLYSLSGQTKELYLNMSKKLLEIAKEKHPERNYVQMERTLGMDRSPQQSTTEAMEAVI